MSPPEASSMKALMDAVAQVSRHPGYPRPPPSVAGMGAFPFPGVGAVAPQPALSASVSLGPAKKGGPLRKRNHDSALASAAAAAAPAKKARKGSKTSSREAKATKSQRLEQNRLAAIESRRRKKHMVEELQRSVQFYTKANGTLKQQNAELERQLLTAKQKVLQGATAGTAVAEPASPAQSGPQAPQGASATLPERKPEAQAAAPQPSMDLNDVAALFGSGPTTAEMERQAQQAQYAATQALYKSMGYPAAAAREAAGTFSQYVGQTGIVPGLSSASNQASATVPQVAPPAAPVVPDAVTSTADEGTYVHALNQFAMQQAAAANAAAAAATAAIQAVHLHNQLSGTSGAPSSAVSSPPAVALPFAFPAAGMAWPFQGPNPFAKRD